MPHKYFRWLLYLILPMQSIFAAEASKPEIIVMDLITGVAGNSGNLYEGAYASGYSVFRVNRAEPFKNTHTFGEGTVRVELGSGFGVSGFDWPGSTGNVAKFALQNRYTRFFLLGFEPIANSYSANTNGRRHDYFQWTPALSLGPRFSWHGNSRLIQLAARVGGSFGNLSPAASKLSYGIGLYVHFDQFQVIGEFLRHGYDTPNLTDQIRLSLHYMHTDYWGLGLTLEALELNKVVGDPALRFFYGPDHEYRIFLSLHLYPIFLVAMREIDARARGQ